jgi:hypothetical protein
MKNVKKLEVQREVKELLEKMRAAKNAEVASNTK